MAAVRDSEQIIEVFQEHLADLVLNNKHEINLLTTVANDSISEAPGISRAIENHIRNVGLAMFGSKASSLFFDYFLIHGMVYRLINQQVAPERKLPALYVLDSIAKNVGGAYVQILSKNLFDTFMDAYSLVSPPIRKKLDEMVKTWKEPVPGSTNLRPVFPPEATRRIETTLIKYRILAVQTAQQDQRQPRVPYPPPNMFTPSYPTAGPQLHWRNTATPPQSNGFYQQPNARNYPQINGYPQRPSYPNYSQHPAPQHTPPVFQAPYQPPNPYSSQPPPHQDLSSIHQDIENLIFTTKHEFAARHWDADLQTKLKSLLDLQSYLRNGQLLPNEIQDIREQVTRLIRASRSASLTTSLPPVSTAQPNPVPTPAPPPYPAPPPPATQSPIDLGSTISSNVLADILASAARVNQSTPTPSLPSGVPLPPYHRVSTPQVPPNPVAAPSNTTASLLESLTAMGMLPPNPLAPHGGVTVPQASSLLPPPQQVNSNAPSIQPANTSQAAVAERFLITEEGKRKKARHLDWHFQTNQRLADAARRIQSRSWYIDEMEWIRSRDNIDEDAEAGNGGESGQAKAAAEAAKNDPKHKRIPVPSDPALSNAPCPICQEKFEPSWDDESQDFVWRDAIQIGSRVYHASCHAEVRKDGASTPMRTGTPDSVLGKRKAGASLQLSQDEVGG
ncbi:hypothetical protein Q9189_001524 [Teloschistes chrysophthalmus]